MKQEDQSRSDSDSEFTEFSIDTSDDSKRTKTRRPRKRPSYLPVIMLAMGAIASIAALIWVLNRPPETRKIPKPESTREIAAETPQKRDRPAKKTARKIQSPENPKQKEKPSTPEKKDEKADGAENAVTNNKKTRSAKVSEDDLLLGTNVDNSGLSDAPDVLPEKRTDVPPEPPREEMQKSAEEPDETPNTDEEVFALYESGRLLVPKSYKALRAIHAKDFSVKHAKEIDQAFRDESESLHAWLDENIDLKEELYLALDPEHDNIVSALGLFRDLKKQFPQCFPAYGELAIATVVVWDKGGRGVRDCDGHQRRTKSKMPKNRVGAVENFKYLVDAEKLMGGRVRFLPWEFLTHTVNHRTPIDERKWALGNYLQKRIGFGKCYHDVPYDHGMLAGEPPRLTDQYYTLENIRRYGGVCAMQADFANRVGKSLGVPAEYVGGESRGGEHHAWVMWVELMGVSKGKIAFELKSYGRYRGDRYYVGGLTDSQTGRRITDRQLELRLHNVGLNPQNKRHAALVMKSFPAIRDKAEMSVVDQLHFLHNVMKLSPGNEEAWKTLAAMSRDGKINKSHSRKMTPLLEQLFTTFANFPDFTWEVFDDLVACNDSQKQKNLLYERLVNLYVQAKRPDLACQAVLKYADNLAEDNKGRQAIEALGMTIMAFPDEGRYVPKMLDAVEELCPKVAGADKHLVKFYQMLLPKIPQRRGKKPQPYCIKMYKRGIDFFEKSGKPELAGPWRMALAKLEADLK